MTKDCTTSLTLLAAGSANLRKTAAFFRGLRATLMAGAVVWAFPIFLVIVMRLAQSSGATRDHDAPEPYMAFVFCAFPLMFFPIVAAAALELRLKLRTDFADLATALPDPKWQELIQPFIRCSRAVYGWGAASLIPYVVPIAIGFCIAWHLRLGKLCGFIATQSDDARLIRLIAESRKTAIVLLLVVLLLPAVLWVLYCEDLLTRFGAMAVIPVMGYISYTLLVLRAACSRAAQIVEGLSTVAAGSNHNPGNKRNSLPNSS